MISLEQLRHTGGLNAFTDAELDTLLGAASPRVFEPGALLGSQGRPATACYVVVSGVVDVVKSNAKGERLLRQMTAGAIAGQLALVDGAPRTASLRAATEVVALELSRDVFDSLVRASSPLAYRFQLQIAVATVRQLREADHRLAMVMSRRTPAQTPSEPAAPATLAERVALLNIQDAVGDLDVPFLTDDEVSEGFDPPR